jgi:hypothetical protein
MGGASCGLHLLADQTFVGKVCVLVSKDKTQRHIVQQFLLG